LVQNLGDMIRHTVMKVVGMLCTFFHCHLNVGLC
jgi:hypothetical protein